MSSDLEKIIRRICDHRLTHVAKGYDARHDDEHTSGEIVFDHEWGAVSYLNQRDCRPTGNLIVYEDLLVEAASLIIAELERIERIKNS